ncbi:putative reverse transcriptase domain-containing protein [Tanacetum coccineum]
MENIIPLDHVDDLPVVDPNQPDVVLVIPKSVLMDKDKDLEEEEFKEEEEPQEEEDIDIDDEEDENEPELTFPYEEAYPFNPPPPTSDLEPEDVIKVEDTVEPGDETVPASVHKVGESSTATFLQEDDDRLLPGFMRRDIDSFFGQIASLSRRVYGRKTAHALVEKKGKSKDKYYAKLITDLGNEVRSSMEEGAAAMENLVRKLGNAEERAECKKLKKKLEDARIMPPKSAPLTQAVVWRMIKESVDAAITAKRVRQANAGNNASGSGQARGQVTAPCAKDKKVKFASATPTARMENELWNLKVKEYNMVAYTQRFNELFLMCPRMVEPESAKIKAYIRGLSDNIKGEVTSSKPTNLNEAMCMVHKLMEQKLQARNERTLEGNKRKWENFQSGNNSGKSNYKDNSRQSSQNNQKKGKARTMNTAPNEGKVSSGSLPVCKCCFTCHDTSVERLGTKQGTVRKRMLPRV